MSDGKSTTSTRHDAFGPRKRQLFLDKLRNTCNVRASCQAANIDRKTAYNHKESDPEFAAQWEQAEQEAVDLLEAKAWNNAMQKDSETSLWNLLKAHRPQKYKDKTDNYHWDMSKLTDDQLRALAEGKTPGPGGA